MGGECICFLRLCSHESYYKISWERLGGALIIWGYPPSLTTKPKFSWNVQLFATLQPPPNLGKLFHGWRTRVLRKACAPDI